jgi:hypothetical protein
MIDFANGAVFKLREADREGMSKAVEPLLVTDEQVLASFKAVRDYVVFTDRRIIAVNVQGLTGKKKDFTSLPYSKVQAFSIETAGAFDLDAELDLWFSGLGKVRLEFVGQYDVQALSRTIARFIL